MKAHNNFIRELLSLESFHTSTLYAYQETESLLHYWRKNKFVFDEQTESNHLVGHPTHFGTKRSRRIDRRKSLNEIVFVRVISALEVFLVDLVRDAFLETKEPFKKQDLVFQLSQAEILSIKSPANLYNKVINKECRKLSSSGFLEIVKYYKKHFMIDMSGFSPGKNKMEEYHERRHLLVHRLGKTDSQYRKKYNTTKLSISIDYQYLVECFEDLRSFCEMVQNQMIYQLKNEYLSSDKRHKLIERSIILKISFEDGNKDLEYFNPDYEFWSQDEFSVLKDILDSQLRPNDRTLEMKLSGTLAQIRSYTRIIKRVQKREGFETEITKDKQNSNNGTSIRILDIELLQQIKNKLPQQPWTTGIHKEIALELDVSNRLVSIAIQQLIARGDFKQQINGKMLE